MKWERQILGGPGMRSWVSRRKETLAGEEEMRLKTDSQGPPRPVPDLAVTALPVTWHEVKPWRDLTST